LMFLNSLAVLAEEGRDTNLNHENRMT